MARHVKLWLLTRLFSFVRSYFVGRVVTRMALLDGQPMVQAEGRVVGGNIVFDPQTGVLGLTFIWVQSGNSIRDIYRLPVTKVKRDKHMGWVFYD